MEGSDEPSPLVGHLGGVEPIVKPTFLRYFLSPFGRDVSEGYKEVGFIVFSRKAGNMPSIFKTLATIIAWILWIFALVMGFSAFAMGIIKGDLYSTSVTPPLTYTALFAVAGFYAILAVVIMLLRKKME